MMPTDVVNEITRCYIADLQALEIDPTLCGYLGGLHRSRNLAGLTSCTVHFNWHTHSIREWQALRQIEAFYKKNALFADAKVCFSSASETFLRNEAACSETNTRLAHLVGKPHLLGEARRNEVTSMARYISNVLGDFPSFIKDLPYLVKVTPGATATRKRADSLPQLKMGMKPWASPRCSKYLYALYRFYGFEPPRVRPMHTNRVELVPKNWKTNRTIACEPEGNVSLQLAFDSWTKHKLKMFGIDLADQSANQRAAKQASIDNKKVTVDFSSASDTISYNTVSLLFPVEWFEFLRNVRTPGYRGVFGKGVYSKFSSMGNGTTFCIETLIFAAACYAVGSRDFLVYGDDVIIEKEFYEAYCNLTGFLGFTINDEKSFSDGPFRESCGADYFNGVRVTPVYIRNVDARKASLCHLVNTIESIAVPGGKLEEYLISLVRENRLPYVPFNNSTMSGIWIYPDVARAKGILTMKNDMSTYRAFVPKSTKRKFVDSRGYYLWFLRKNSQVLFSHRGESIADRLMMRRHRRPFSITSMCENELLTT